MSRCVIITVAAAAAYAAPSFFLSFFSLSPQVDGCNVCHHRHKSYSRFAAPIIFPSLNKSLLY